MSRRGFTLGFHIILVPFGEVFTFVTVIANYRGIRHGDAEALLLAERWPKVAAVLFTVGAVSGTVLRSRWGCGGRPDGPVWRRLWHPVHGGEHFFLEAIFVAIYIYGWKRVWWRVSGDITSEMTDQ